MRLVYVDESMEDHNIVISALMVSESDWNACLDTMKCFRLLLKQAYGIYSRKEVHAREWVSGRGEIASEVIGKWERCRLFDDMLRMVSTLPNVRLFNVVTSKSKLDWGFERLVNRLHRCMVEFGDHAILICDEGKESIFTPLARKMRVHNPVPSKFGGWGPDFDATKNVPARKLIEDPFFIRSDRSFFIQYVDCCAYALLRSEFPLPSKSKYGLHRSFDLLNAICHVQATKLDHRGLGIIRV